MASIIEDANGKVSSKRVAGFTAFGVSVVLSAFAVFFSYKALADTADIIVNLVKAFLAYSGTMLGVGVGESLLKTSVSGSIQDGK